MSHPYSRDRRASKALGRFLCAMAWIVLPQAAQAVESLCARVQIQIHQTLTLERQGFDATMTIHNGLPISDIENVSISVWFENEQRQRVPATSLSSDTNALFFIRVSSRKNIDNITGTGRVPASTTSEIHWLIIPAPGAGGDDPLGRGYYVGADLSYRVAGEDHYLQVSPDFIRVQPMPQLTLDYFLPIEVYGDDPFTPAIEPPVPFSLGVRVKNTGYGPAQRLRIDSAQPRIIDNVQGLLVGFRILGSEVNGAAAARTLRADFGALRPSSAGVARWMMECTLSGQFIDFGAYFTHADDLGGELTSLIRQVNTHRLVHDVLVDLPGRDSIRDFLALYGDGGYYLYESDMVDTPVVDFSPLAILTPLEPAGDSPRFSVVIPLENGPLYAKIPFAQGAGRSVQSVVRGDGKVIHPANVWISKTRGEGFRWDYFLNLFDVKGGGTYTVALDGAPPVENLAPVLQYIGPRSVLLGDMMAFLLQASDPNETIPGFSMTPQVPGSTLTDHGDGTASFQWTPTPDQYGVHPVRFIASDGQLTDWEIVKLYVGQAGEGRTAEGLPLSLADWRVPIRDLLVEAAVGVATVVWDSVEGIYYDVHVSDNPFTPGGAWYRIQSYQQAEGPESDYRDSHLGQQFNRRYYRITLAGDSPDSAQVWGVIRRDVAPGYTMISPPLRMDRRFDGELGWALAEELDGHDGGLGAGGDEVYVLESGGSWRMLYLDASGVWREADGSVSSYELPPGRGFWVVRKSGSPVRLTFAGPVGNDGSQTTTLQPGFNLIGLSEGKDLPLTQSLAAAGPLGGAWEEEADQLIIQRTDGSWRFLMHISGWGVPFDGKWFDMSTFQVVAPGEVLEPGAAYYYLRRGEGTQIEF